MKKEKGFTLVELIATIVIIGLIALFALPQVLNQYSNHTEELSKQQEDMIVETARSYVLENGGKYPNKGGGENYCISMQEMINAGALDIHIAEHTFGKENYKNYKVTASYKGSSVSVSLSSGSC